VRDLSVVLVFGLVFLRVSALMVAAPFYGSLNFPVRVKLSFALLISALITPVLPPVTPSTVLLADAAQFALAAVKEVLVGLCLGFLMTLVFAAIQIAGQLLDMQSGFAMVTVFNPTVGAQFPIYGFFLFVLAMLYLLVMGGHHMILRLLAESFTAVPIGALNPTPGAFAEVVYFGSRLFVQGVMLSAPVLASVLLAYATLGLLGRVVPQIHLLSVGFPITIALSLFILAMSLSIYLQVVHNFFGEMFNQVARVMYAL
jgi:flagellar biosynthetic protein FliR